MHDARQQLLDELQELHALYIGECRTLSDDEVAEFNRALAYILNELDELEGILPPNNISALESQLGGSNDRSE